MEVEGHLCSDQKRIGPSNICQLYFVFNGLYWLVMVEKWLIIVDKE